MRISEHVPETFSSLKLFSLFFFSFLTKAVVHYNQLTLKYFEILWNALKYFEIQLNFVKRKFSSIFVIQILKLSIQLQWQLRIIIMNNAKMVCSFTWNRSFWCLIKMQCILMLCFPRKFAHLHWLEAAGLIRNHGQSFARL